MKAPKVNQAEDKILDEYLAGKSHLSDSYKNIATDLPGVDIDSAILAASRREVNARPNPLGAEGWRKWQLPLSIAAVLVISASLTLTMVDFQNKSDEIPIESAPIVVKEEAKATRGDSFGQSKPEVTDANKTSASPMRKLEPVERIKQKMAPPEAPTPKTNDTRITPSEKATAPRAPAENKSEVSAQAFPSVTAKTVDTTRAAAENSVLNEQVSARSGQSAPMPAAMQGVAGSVANKAPIPVAPSPAAPAPVPASVAASAAPAPAVAADNDAAISAQAKSVRSAASAPAAMSAETSRAAAPQAMRKTELTSEGATAATYAAAQTWLAKIEALLRESKTAEAEQTLAEFKLRFPNYVTPDAIKEELAKQRAALNNEPGK
jgi:hypothetical protein